MLRSHADDHVVLLETESKTLFSGDNVLGVGTTVFRDLSAYMDSLHRMRGLVVANDVATIFPAHGPVIPAALEKIDEYIHHRATRIAQVEAELPSCGDSPLTCIEITRKIYTEIPIDLIPAAANNTMLVLNMLLADSKAVCSGSEEGADVRRWRKVASKI